MDSKTCSIRVKPNLHCFKAISTLYKDFRETHFFSSLFYTSFIIEPFIIVADLKSVTKIYELHQGLLRFRELQIYII